MPAAPAAPLLRQEFPPALEPLAPSIRVIDATNNRIATLPPYLAAFTALQVGRRGSQAGLTGGPPGLRVPSTAPPFVLAVLFGASGPHVLSLLLAKSCAS